MAAPDFWELRGEQGDTNGNLLCQILSKGSCSSVFSVSGAVHSIMT